MPHRSRRRGRRAPRGSTARGTRAPAAPPPPRSCASREPAHPAAAVQMVRMVQMGAGAPVGERDERQQRGCHIPPHVRTTLLFRSSGPVRRGQARSAAARGGWAPGGGRTIACTASASNRTCRAVGSWASVPMRCIRSDAVCASPCARRRELHDGAVRRGFYSARGGGRERESGREWEGGREREREKERERERERERESSETDAPHLSLQQEGQ